MTKSCCGAIRNLNKTADPTFVRMKDNFFIWKEAQLPNVNEGRDHQNSKFYDDASNVIKNLT